MSAFTVALFLLKYLETAIFLFIDMYLYPSLYSVTKLINYNI